MVWIGYNLLFAVGFLLMLPHFLWRMRRRGGYARDFGHRFGRYAPDLRARLAGGGRVWVHAVSVGELFVALALMSEWRRRRPGVRFVLSTTTSTAYRIAGRELGADDALIYFPVDAPPIMRRVLDLLRPAALVLMETEIWPNLIRLAAARGVPVFLANGRLSERSARRYGYVAAFTRRVLPLLRGAFMQSDGDAARFVGIGARPDRTQVTGTVKYDVALAPVAADIAAVRREAGVVMGGSTWAGEEAALLDAFIELRRSRPGLSLVLAPRHAERRAEVLGEIARRGLSVASRSAGQAQGDADVFLLDTTGELKGFYACADVIFIGKSLTQHGGQNPLEPAAAGKAVLTGPNMENFGPVMDDLRAAGGVRQVADAAALAAAIGELLDDPAKRAALGDAARRAVEARRGALGRMVEQLLAEGGL